MTNFPQIIAGLTGTLYDIVFVPEQRWLKMREEFLVQFKKSSNASNQQQTVHSSGEEATENVQSMLVEEQHVLQNPVVDEAVKLFGEDFVEIVDD